MFEYIDDKLGKVKLINVTEARANFSKLLSDMDSYYVITKNNRPQRVVINYDEFQEIKTQFLAAQKKEIKKEIKQEIKEEVLPEKLETIKPTKDVANSKSQSRVKGLLAKQFEMVNAQQNVVEEESYESKSEEPSVQNHFEQTVETQTTKTHQTEDDYFQTALSDEESFEMPSPDMAFSEDDQNQSEENLLEDLEKELDQVEDFQEESLNLKHVEEDDHEEEPLEDAAKETLIEDKNLSPEEENYYNKYRKLYERFEPQEEEIESQEDDSKINLEEEIESFVETLPELEEDENSFEEQNQFDDSEDEISHKEEISIASTTLAAMSEEQNLKTTSKDQSEKPDHLPSLQELLRGLDSSAEKSQEDLSEQEIDDIVKRIRHEE